MTSNDQKRNQTPTELVNKPTVNICSDDKKGKPFFPPFLLMFEVFNRNLHNCLFKYAHEYARNCKTCQISTGREKREEVPLQPVTISRLFNQWGLDIIRDITKISSKQHKYILTVTD
jgi:hypothetical protein